MSEVMTMRERTELTKHVRHRERVFKTLARERSAELMADFEKKLAARYRFDDDAVWAEATKIADQAMEEANKQIARRSQQLGIPKSFAPRLGHAWYDRGENMAKERRAELRRVAKARIEVLERKAITKIETEALDLCTEILHSGIESVAAKRFLQALPPLGVLMPELNISEIDRPRIAREGGHA